MRLVHDEVAGLELQRVDHILAPIREPLHLARVVPDRSTVELALAEHSQFRLRQFETGFNGCLQQVCNAGFGIRRERIDTSRGNAVLAKRLDSTLDQAATLGDHGDGPTVGQARPDMIDRAIGLAAEARNRIGVDADVIPCAFNQFGFRRESTGTTVESTQRPPRAVAGRLVQAVQ